MKAVYSLFLLCITLNNIFSQTIAVYDSVSTHAGNTDMVFYRLNDGQKTNSSNHDWHLAVSVRPSLFPGNTLQGTTLRINEQLGINVYQIPNFTADSFSLIVDTTGYHTWNHLHDSDTVLDMGALNNGLNIAVYNYGWGIYSGPPNHDVTGRKVYLFELPNGALKKFWVEQLDRDTAWELKYADLDNSNLQSIHIGKAAHSNKNFVYLNMLNNQVHDKEPLSTDWDLQFIKYAASDILPASTYPAVGVWTNKGERVAEVNGVDAATVDNAGANPFSANMNAIGWDWKVYNTGAYQMRDSLAYFIQANSGVTYKIVFTHYGDSATGVITFYKQEFITGISKTENEMVVEVFPNPTSSVLNIVTGLQTETEFKVFDVEGKLVSEKKVTSPILQFNTAEMQSGIYFLTVTAGSSVARKRFVVNQ